MSLKTAVGTGLQVASTLGLVFSLSTCMKAKQDEEDTAAQIRVLEELAASNETEKGAVDKKLYELNGNYHHYSTMQSYGVAGIVGSCTLLGFGSYLQRRRKE